MLECAADCTVSAQKQPVNIIDSLENAWTIDMKTEKNIGQLRNDIGAI